MADGNFTRPSLVLDPDSALGIVTEEQFGPSVPPLPFTDESTVVDQANDGRSGLGASVWSAEEERAGDLVARLRSGYGWVNAHGANFVHHRAPFGGLRGSGTGRESGIDGVREFMDLQSVSTVPPAA